MKDINEYAPIDTNSIIGDMVKEEMSQSMMTAEELEAMEATMWGDFSNVSPKDTENYELGSIEKLKDGTETPNKLFYIKSISKAQTTKGAGYLRGTITDEKDDIEFRIWNYEDEQPKENAINIHKYKSDFYNNTPQAIIEDMTFVNANLSKLPYSFNMDIVKENTLKMINIVKEPVYRKLLDHFIVNNQEYWLAPAAVQHHHAYKGGLAQHCCEVANMALDTASRMAKYEGSKLNKELLITGGLLHDIGKTKIYSMNGLMPVYNEELSLYEHIVLGTLMIREYLLDNGLYKGNESKVALIDHIILSHHGIKEYGSPVNPQFKEAWLVSQADSASSQFNKLEILARVGGLKTDERIKTLEWNKLFTDTYMEKIFK